MAAETLSQIIHEPLADEKTAPRKPELISLEERLERALEAKWKAEEINVEIDFYGEIVTGIIEVWQVDYRTDIQIEAERTGKIPMSPVACYIPGFGQMDATGPLTPLEERFAQLADSDNYGFGQFIKISVGDIPIKTVREKETGVPSFEVDAQLIMEEFIPRVQLGGEIPPLQLYAYSEGAGVVISLAALTSNEIDKEAPQGKHEMTLLSLTGIAPAARDVSRARQAVYQFSKVAAKVAWDQITSKFPELGRKIKESTERKIKPLQRFLRLNEPGSEEAEDENQDESPLGYLIWGLKDAGTRTKNIGKATKRVAKSYKGLEPIRNQAFKIIRTNLDCDRVGSAFDVTVRLPLGDNMYELNETDRFLREEKETHKGPVPAFASLETTIAHAAFPKANNVVVEFVGEMGQGKSPLKQHHYAPELYPDIYLPDKKADTNLAVIDL